MFLYVVEASRDERKASTHVGLPDKVVLLRGNAARCALAFNSKETAIRKDAEDVGRAHDARGWTVTA